MSRRRRASILALAVVWIVALALPGHAGAHAVLVRAEPADGSALAQGPHQIGLRFSEAISPRFRRAHLVDAHGRIVRGTALLPGGDGRSLVLRTPPLRRGTYEVLWNVLAEDDGHVTDGAVVFGVGARPAGAHVSRTADAAPPPGDVVLRWLDFSLLAVLVGGLGVGLLVGRAAAPPGVAGAATSRVLAWASRSAALALVLGLVLVVRQAQGLLPTLPPGGSILDALGELLTARWGILWLLREALLAGLLVVALQLRRPSRLYVVAAACAIGVVVCRALGAHAAAVGRSELPVAADAVHVLAACVWVGGMLALAIALWPVGDVGRAGSVALARACRGGVAWAAALSVAVLAATGLYAAGVQVSSVDGLLTTVYGRTLIIKAGLVLGAGAIGLANFALLRSLGRDPAPRGLGALRRLGAPRLLLAEATLGLEVLVAAAILTASSPPRGPEFGPPQAVRAPTLVRQVDDVLVSASARPNRPGTNLLTVRTASSRRPPPAPIDAVTVALAPAGAGRGGERAVSLRELGPGRYSGGAELPQDGQWRMTVALRRGGERLSARFDWPVQPPDPARPVRYSAARLAPVVDRAAVPCLLLALAGTFWLALRGRRRPRRIPTLTEEATT